MSWRECSGERAIPFLNTMDCNLLASMSSTVRLRMSSSVAASPISPFLFRLSRSFFSSRSLTASVAASRVLACFLTELSCVCAFQSSLLFLRPKVPRR